MMIDGNVKANFKYVKSSAERKKTFCYPIEKDLCSNS